MMEKPFPSEFDTIDAYRIAYAQYIKDRAEDGSSAPHHEQSYPVAFQCPVCEYAVRVETGSVVDDPIWRCLGYGNHWFELDGEEIVQHE